MLEPAAKERCKSVDLFFSNVANDSENVDDFCKELNTAMHTSNPCDGFVNLNCLEMLLKDMANFSFGLKESEDPEEEQMQRNVEDERVDATDALLPCTSFTFDHCGQG